MPRASQFQAGILEGMGISRDGHLVIQPPAPLALLTEKVVNRALDDLAKCPELPGHRVFKFLLPLRPSILLTHRGGRLQQLPARTQRGSYLRTQFPRECGNGLFNIDLPTIYRLAPE